MLFCCEPDKYIYKVMCHRGVVQGKTKYVVYGADVFLVLLFLQCEAPVSTHREQDHFRESFYSVT